MKLDDNIDSNTLIKFIESLDDDFWFTLNYSGELIAMYWKDTFISGLSKGRIPRHDEFAWRGSLKKRGYQHILGRVWVFVRDEHVCIGHAERQKLLNVLRELRYFDNRVDYWAHKSDEYMDIQKKKEMLYSKHGVTIGEYLPDELK